VKPEFDPLVLMHLSIASVDAKTLPVLLSADIDEVPRIELSALKYARYVQRQGTMSYGSLTDAVRCIGRLIDFYRWHYGQSDDTRVGPHVLAERFLHAYDHGAFQGWRPATNARYHQARLTVGEFLKFLADSNSADWPEREHAFIEACRQSWQSASHAQHSLLFHTKRRPRIKRRGRKRQVVGLRHVRPFPADLVDDLLALTKNPRDRLLFGLLACGGRRVSEMLHLFLQDIGEAHGELHVVLRHPSHSPMAWRNQAHAVIQGTRREYLQSMFGLLPRTEHGARPTSVGWKGIRFDDERLMSSDVYFIRQAEKKLLPLHQAHLATFRQHVPRRPHPYYFVSESGEPLTVRAVEKQFELAVRRVEKRTGRDLSGFRLHSLRHGYGCFCAAVLNAPLLVLQKWMGHVRPSTTAAYTNLPPDVAHAYMQEKWREALTARPIRPLEPQVVDRITSTGGLTPFSNLSRRLP